MVLELPDPTEYAGTVCTRLFGHAAPEIGHSSLLCRNRSPHPASHPRVWRGGCSHNTFCRRYPGRPRSSGPRDPGREYRRYLRYRSNRGDRARDGLRPGRDSGVGAGEPHEDGRSLIGVEGVEEVLPCRIGLLMGGSIAGRRWFFPGGRISGDFRKKSVRVTSAP